MAGKRIYELTEKSTLEGSDYLAIDGSGLTEARKVAASKLLSFANVADSSDEYSSTKAYKVGDLVIHDNKLYECTTACSAAAWSTNQGYFSQRSLTTIGTELKSSLTWKEFTSGATSIPSTRIISLPSNYSECEIFINLSTAQKISKFFLYQEIDNIPANGVLYISNGVGSTIDSVLAYIGKSSSGYYLYIKEGNTETTTSCKYRIYYR